MQYDGTSRLTPAIANLCGLSEKSKTPLAKLVKHAKASLGITSKSKHLPAEVNLAIYRWHYERLNPVQSLPDTKPDSDDVVVQDTKQTNGVDSVYNVKHDGSGVYTVKLVNNDRSGNDLVDNSRGNSRGNSSRYDNSRYDNSRYDNSRYDNDAPVCDFKQIHFGVTVAGKRTTVMLEGYLVRALRRKYGLLNNAAIRAWIEQSIKNDGVRFDSHSPLTRQVKRLIVESFV